ncbi:thiolase family protein [Saccharomonospora sp. NPDC046836]|uniref:thiolase family protein n=1 Tax=Saccharomonospora sp. NPDC046836 TaxID=3156921 RepID=UPI0034002AF3
MDRNTEKIVVLDGARTPIGRFQGVFKDVPAHELGGKVVTEALRRSGLPPERVGEVVMGQVGQVGPDAFNARRVALAAGLAKNTPAVNVNRLCGSGLQAIWTGAMELRWGGVDAVVAGGDESMTRMPFYDYSDRSKRRLGDVTLHDGTLMMLTDPWSRIHMGITAENVATKYDVSRQAQDEFALESQRRAASDAAKAAFTEEIVPFEIGGRRPRTVETDEHPRPDTTMEMLSGLSPAFADDGTVTAGNSSGINDGAAALVLTRESYAREHGLKPLVSLDAITTAAMEPELMGYTPVLALNALFEKTGLSPSDIAIAEVNEAFAAQAVAVIRDAKLDPATTNPYGGAIALGHPVGATGANLTLRVARHLVRHDQEFGIVTMCIGGGQALAALFRRV